MIKQMREDYSTQSDLQFKIIEILNERELSIFNQLNQYNGIILTGSPLNLSELNDPMNQKWTPFQRKKINVTEAFIRQYKKPILGICFGHQLLAHSFEPRYIRRMEGTRFNTEANSGKPRISTIQIDSGFELWDEGIYYVELNHNDEVRNSNWTATGRDYDEWTRNRRIAEYTILPFKVHGLSADPSISSIQAIRHQNFPYYGVQCHPEFNFDTRTEFQHLVKQLQNSGKKLIRNFINLVISHCQ
jgi:GMP synthase-like glutamine amidotransferase